MEKISPYLTQLIADGYSVEFLLVEGMLICPAYPSRCYKICEVPPRRVIPDPRFQVNIYVFVTPDGLRGTFVLHLEGALEEY